MKILYTLFLSIYFLAFDNKPVHYEVECGETAQWLDGKKSCNRYDESVFLTVSDATNHEKFTVFKLKIQNIGNDTLHFNPRNCYISRVYTNGSIDSVAICNPEMYIEKADAQIAQSEKEINAIIKTRNTENTAVTIAKSMPWANKINTNNQASTAIYNEKLKSAQNNLLDAKAQKVFWESQALRANTIQPLSYVEGNVFFETNACIKVILHVHLNHQSYDFLISQITE